MKVSELMYVGVLIAGFSMLRDRRSGTELAVGVLAMIHAVGVPTAVVMTIFYRVKAKMIKYKHFEEKNTMQRLLLPWGFWAPADVSSLRQPHWWLPPQLPQVPLSLTHDCCWTRLHPLPFLFVALVFIVSAIEM